MIDITFIREHAPEVKEALKNRGKDTSVVDTFLSVDQEWKKVITEVEELRKLQKDLTKDQKREEAKKNKEDIKEKTSLLNELEEKRHQILVSIPNIPSEKTPIGKDESENVEIEKIGDIPSFSFEPQDHIALGESLNIIDLERAAEVSGSRFYYLKNEGVLLEFALIQFALSELTQKGFEPVIPPVMIRPDIYESIGRLTEDQKEERYYLPQDDLYLIGSAEHTIAPLHRGEIFNQKDLPKRYVGFSTCFRREAGSYGKDTKGILRVHQFDKVELYSFTSPEESEKEHLFLLEAQKELYKALNIPFRVVEICTGDMGPTDARQFDIEAWIPSQKTYREVASCSNTTDYQMRGTQTKVRTENNETVYAHALNATGIAIGRTLLAIMENNQQEDGSIRIPDVLVPFVGKDSINKNNA